MKGLWKKKRSLIVICACLAALIPTLDHLSKYFVRTLMSPGDSTSVIGEFFRVTYVLNDGMAFGTLGGAWRWVFMILTPLTLILVAYLFFRYFEKLRTFTAVSLVMIFSGGLSNMIDRIFFYNLDPNSTGLFDGRVVDFLDFNITLFGRRVWNAVFNVADAFVVVGVFLLLIMIIVNEVAEAKKKKAAAGKTAGDPSAKNTDAAATETDASLEGADTPEEDSSDAAEPGGDGE